MAPEAQHANRLRDRRSRLPAGAIDQASLLVFGTAIPNHYYEALSERMLTNGFFARMIILECGARGAGQKAKVLDIPERMIATAKWWKELMPGNGNLQSWHPVPNIVPQSAEAVAILRDPSEITVSQMKPSIARLNAGTILSVPRCGDESMSKRGNVRSCTPSVRTIQNRCSAPMLYCAGHRVCHASNAAHALHSRQPRGRDSVSCRLSSADPKPTDGS